MSLEADLKSTIEKNLAAEVADLLKGRLAKAELDDKRVAELSANVEGLMAQRSDLLARLQRQEELAARESQLAELKRSLDERQIRLEMREKLVEVRLDDHQRFIDKIFGNRVLRERIQQKIPVECPGHAEGNPYNSSHEPIAVNGGEMLEDTETTTEREEA